MKKQKNPTPSIDLQKFMVTNSIASIDELIQIPDAVLITKQGFGWRLLKEILLFRKIQ
jgi:hypothetical protein